MRATTLLAGATLAMAIAAPRAARSAGIASRSGARGTLVLTVATAGASGAIAKLRGPGSMLGADQWSASAQVVDAVLESPQLALAIARGSSQLSVAPTYEKIGRSRSPGIAFSGRF
jgi:hypothetical protein